ncbi:hypothetical protein AVEN_5085-1 [Araneus ventricosus]|uniref:Cuticle protein 16.8 n=1 Tax=Araneus ventricosus TaxID=182803 RepID=A0A4Y2M0J5_ARAVE|nr:hypothetical protein AVEN_5085-1 [Araneus ventricosus]
MAIVGQAVTTGEGPGPGTANYGLSSVNYGGGGTSSASLRGGSSVNYGGSSSFASSGVSGTTSSRGSVRGSYGGFHQNEAHKPYNFDYKSADEQGNTHYHREEADGSGAVRGSYGYTDVQGLYRVVDYIADANGFRASIRTNEPGTDGKESPADVQMSVDQPPAGIQDRYTTFSGTGGQRDFASRTVTGQNIKFEISPIPVRNSGVQVRPSPPPILPVIATVVRQTYKSQSYPASPGRNQSDEDDDEEE